MARPSPRICTPARRHGLDGLARPARAAASQCCPRLAGGELVRHRSSHWSLRGEARRRGRRQGDRAICLVGRRGDARDGLCRLAVEWPARLWRHAVGPRGGLGNSGSQGARLRRHALSVHLDGCAGRECPARPLFGRDRAAGLSLARTHHLHARARASRERWTRPALAPRRWRPSWARRRLPISPSPAIRCSIRVPLSGRSAVRAALRASLRSRRRGRRLHRRFGDARRHHVEIERVELSLRHGAGRSGRRCEERALARHQAHLRGRLDRASRASAAGRQRRRLFPSRSALGLERDRRGRHRCLLAAVGLARRRGASRLPGGRPLDLRSRLSARQYPGRGGVRLLLSGRRRTGNDASPERIAQERLAITDGAYGKPWVYQPKATLEWWQNHHYDRPGGVESARPTAWMPEVEADLVHRARLPGCGQGLEPAERVHRSQERGVDRALLLAPRQGRFDPARAISLALLSFFDPDHSAYVAGSNPISSLYGAPMVDGAHSYVYTWDARPYPAFPYALSVWADGGNWELGHWLTGRVGGGGLASMVRQILEDYGFTRYEVGPPLRLSRWRSSSTASCRRVRRSSRSGWPICSMLIESRRADPIRASRA